MKREPKIGDRVKIYIKEGHFLHQKTGIIEALQNLGSPSECFYIQVDDNGGKCWINRNEFKLLKPKGTHPAIDSPAQKIIKDLKSPYGLVSPQPDPKMTEIIHTPMLGLKEILDQEEKKKDCDTAKKEPFLQRHFRFISLSVMTLLFILAIYYSPKPAPKVEPPKPPVSEETLDHEALLRVMRICSNYSTSTEIYSSEGTKDVIKLVCMIESNK